MSSTQSLVVLSLIGLIDSISYMAVAPSLIFYVLQVGGSKEMYGLIMSAFSLASFCGKPVYGIWVDKGGNKFRTPYVASFVLAIFGAILYFIGNAATSPSTAVALIFVGRLFSGLGGANQALGFAYLASVIPLDEQTKTSTILSMMRIIGMTTGPLVNLVLSKIDTTITLFGYEMAVDPLNSVGIVLAMGNLLAMACVVFLLDEPPEKEKRIKNVLASGVGSAPQQGSIWEGIMTIEILLPIFILLVVNSSFQLIETAFPAAAADGLGWGPVQTSAVLGSTSIVIFFCMIVNIFLSGKVDDIVLVAVGNLFWIFGGLGMYLYWIRDADMVNYVLPIFIACMGFPFISSCNRSNFTKAVASTPALEESVALMQSVLSMAASVAGFVTPGFVAAFVLRTAQEVDASGDNRELTPVALYVPILPIPILFGLWLQYRKEKRQLASEKEGSVNETSGLLGAQAREKRRSSVITIEQSFSRRTSVDKRISGQMMGGLTAFDTKDEHNLNLKLEKDLQDWTELSEMDYDDDE